MLIEATLPFLNLCSNSTKQILELQSVLNELSMISESIQFLTILLRVMKQEIKVEPFTTT